ncbi:MAG TPA: diphthine--ammonia ligase [Polyangiaceae bacterium]|nr:diphthine--ammonia ligase [Polyangiaceae bacterium]
MGADGDAPAFCSLSGGKDSCLALFEAREAGLDVRTVLVMLDESGDRSRSHGIPPALLELQAQALGARLVTRTASWKDYEAVFTETLRELREEGHEVGVFGDIDLLPHREWEERVCAAAGITPHLPLWLRNRTELAHRVIALGFRAIVVCVDSRFLPDSFAGREYDERFLADLPPGVDACGENGEFHTFVYDGPCFSRPVPCRVESKEVYVAPAEYGGTRYCFARVVRA